MIEVRVPDEQEGTKAVVRAWLKQVGDPVAENDPLVELETDKVTQEVPAPAAGVLAEIILDTDAEALPGALLGRISAEQVQPKSFVPKSEPRPAEGRADRGLADSLEPLATCVRPPVVVARLLPPNESPARSPLYLRTSRLLI